MTALARVLPGGVLGVVPEGPFTHKILVPFGEPQAVTVTWIGHSTALWQVAGLNHRPDPHFSDRASPVTFAGPKRLTALPMQLD